MEQLEEQALEDEDHMTELIDLKKQFLRKTVRRTLFLNSH